MAFKGISEEKDFPVILNVVKLEDQNEWKASFFKWIIKILFEKIVMQRKGIPMENKTFIDQMGENGYTINDVTFFLDMVKLYEEHYQMSIVDFDINKINSMLNILSPKIH